MNMRFIEFLRPARVAVLLGIALTATAHADLASLFTNLNQTKPPGVPRRPNLILIQCDSLGYLDLSCNGQTNFSTPNIDRLAAGGVLFTNYDAAGVDGATARAAFLLGRAPEKIFATLSAGALTVPQVLRHGGYFSGLFGEWNFGDASSGSAPWNKGFGDFAGFFDPGEAENYYAEALWRYSPQSILNTNTHHWDTYNNREPLVGNMGGARKSYLPDLFTKAAVGFMRNHQPTFANHYQPFFLWLNYTVPRPNQAEAGRTGNGMQVPTDAPYSEEKWPAPQRSKAAMIARLDEDVGTLISALKIPGVSNNVAVFFTSATLPVKTKGPDPMFFPSMVSSNDIRLPMIAWWPGHFPAGRVSGYHWTPADFLPTLAQMAYLNGPTNIDGTSLLPVLYGQSEGK